MNTQHTPVVSVIDAPRPSQDFLEAIIKAFYELPGNGVGGNLHIVLDDQNLKAENVEFCKKQAVKDGDTDAIWLADVLMLYTEDERRGMLAPEGMTYNVDYDWTVP